MDKNKTSPNDSVGRAGKYFKYAIGEIILVVIGILIALSINNWNDQLGEKEHEKEIIQEIISDLKESKNNLEDLANSDSGKLSEYIESMKLVEDYLINQPVYNDSMAIHFTHIFSYRNMLYKITGYETLKSIGFNIISNNDIRKDIGVFFTQTVPQTYRQFDIVETEQNNYLIKYLEKEFNTVVIEDSSATRVLHIPNDYVNLRRNRDFIQAVKMYRYVTQLYFDEIKRSLDRTNKLTSILEDYVKTNF